MAAQLMTKVGMDVSGEYVRVGDPILVDMGALRGTVAVISGFMPASYSNQTVARIRTSDGEEHRFITRILKKLEVRW